MALTVESGLGVDLSLLSEFRKELLSQLAAALVEIADDGQAVRVMLNENLRGLVAVAQNGQRTVVAPFAVALSERPRGRLTATLLRSQAEPILDVLIGTDGMAILEPNRLAIHKGGESKFVPLIFVAPMPRDPRGRLSGTLESIRAVTPAGTCAGTPSAVNCTDASTGQWAAGLNFQRDATLGEYYSAAQIDEGRIVIAPLEGGVRISGTPVTLTGLGPELAAIRSECGVTWVATSAGEPDSLTGMTSNGSPGSDTLPVDGVVTAMWPAGAESAVHVIVRSSEVRKYDLYRVAVDCPR